MASGIEVYRAAAPAVANLVAVRAGRRVGSASGFFVAGRLVTCAHALRLDAGSELHVHFEHAGIAWQYPAGHLPIVGWSDEHSYDYAILDPPPDSALPSALTWGDQPSPGMVVYGLGFPFDDPHLTIHQGIVSSAFKSGVADMLKLNMSVNASNSGGPLLNSAGEIVGVIARKATGLTASFQQLIGSFDANIAAFSNLANTGFSTRMSGVDPVELARITQAQMKAIAIEIERSANVGIGYAIGIGALRSEAIFAGC